MHMSVIAVCIISRTSGIKVFAIIHTLLGRPRLHYSYEYVKSMGAIPRKFLVDQQSVQRFSDNIDLRLAAVDELFGFP